MANLIIKPEAEIDLEDIKRFSLEQFAAEVAEDISMGFGQRFSGYWIIPRLVLSSEV